MVEGVSTRLQRELAQQQKELERLESKLDESVRRLRQDMEQRDADVKCMFEQLMLKMEGHTTGKVVVELPAHVEKSKGDSSASETKIVKPLISGQTLEFTGDDFFRSYKQGRLDYPRFDGTDFSGWLMKMEQYFETGQIREEDKVRVTMMNLEGRALQWHQHYAKSNGGLVALQWSDYLSEMRKRFADTEFSDPMSELVS